MSGTGRFAARHRDAAARVKLLPPATILQRLDRLLDTQGRRYVPARQQTLRNAIQWSHDLLDPPLQGLFRRLSVFVGGGWLAELEAVGHDDDSGLDVLDGISQLVDHSLVSQSIVLGEPRFRMLETIREFARDQLGATDDTEQIQERHAEAYLAVAERAQPELTGPRASEWIDRLTFDRRNIEAALTWAIEAGNAGPAQRLVALGLAVLADARAPVRGASEDGGGAGNVRTRFGGSGPGPRSCRRRSVLAG